MKITEHFDNSEFTCKCGCGKTFVKMSLIERLEKLHSIMNAKAIVVNSGYRCPTHSVAVGGYSNDAHTLGFASDVTVYKQDGNPYTVETVAYYADKLGFGGIGLMGGNSIHLDTRDVEKFSNNYWRGDERTGKNIDIKNLKAEDIQKSDVKPTICIKVDNKTVWCGEAFENNVIIERVK